MSQPRASTQRVTYLASVTGVAIPTRCGCGKAIQLVEMRYYRKGEPCRGLAWVPEPHPCTALGACQ